MDLSFLKIRVYYNIYFSLLKIWNNRKMNIRKFAYSLAVVMLSYASNRDIFYPRNSIGINRRGYSGCGGLEKIVRELKAGKFYYF